MRVAIIGRSEIMWDSAKHLLAAGHTVPLIITAKEAPEYTKTSADFEALAQEIGAVFIHTPNILSVREKITALPAIDIAASINYSGIIPQEIIDLFRLGILNAHGGDLPRYRGNACQAWAMLNGEDKLGLCIHRMIGGELDNGDIIAREYLPISLNTKVAEAWNWMASATPKLFAQAIDALAKNPEFVLEIQSKNPADALRCYPRRPEDARIDWHKRAEDVLRLINASGAPYAGAFCQFENQLLRVIDAELVEDGEQFLAIPGQITAIHTDAVDVACGDGKVRLRTIAYGDYHGSPKGIITSLRQRLG